MTEIRLPVSAIVLTLNEEINLAQCLESLANWVGEIFVIDSGSTDGTLAIADRFGARIVSHPFENYAQQRNWAQSAVPLQYEWVFHIDADERVTPELEKSLRDFFAHENASQYHGAVIARRTVFWGKAILHGGHYPAYHLRLFRHAYGKSEDRLYDQHFVVQGQTKILDGDLLDLITSNLTTWTIRHARWGELEAQEKFQTARDGVRVEPNRRGTPIEQRRWLRASVYERAPLFWRALAYFLYRYFLRLGFLDGVEGLVFHFLQGFWFRFYVDAKIYELQRSAARTMEHDPF